MTDIESHAQNTLKSLYQGRQAVLATMHCKEAAIAPPFSKQLGLTVVVPLDIDTDILGTFSGEIARKGTIEETAVAKARLGMSMTGLPLGIASEGAFGPHPSLPFIPAGIELLVFVDDERGIVVKEHLIEEQTNFAHVVTDDIDSIGDFLSRAEFPEHGLIVRPNATNAAEPVIHKGIRSRAELIVAIKSTLPFSSDGQAMVQTDMRAHQNPKRMASIGRLTERLVQRINNLCPGCRTPGFGRVKVVSGLPCEACDTPSTLVKHEVYGCIACDYSEHRSRPDGLRFAGQFYCPLCNP